MTLKWKLEIGQRNKVGNICYIRGITQEEVINEAKEARKNSCTSNDSGEIEQFIEDNPYSPFRRFLTLKGQILYLLL